MTDQTAKTPDTGNVEGFQANDMQQTKYSTVTTDLKPYARHIPDAYTIPAELHDLPIWCAWKIKYEQGKKPGKLPVSPIDGGRDWQRAEAFCTDLATALKYAEENHKIHGIGLILRPEHGIAGGDLDGCRDPETGAVSEEAQKIIAEANTYTEVSTGTEGFRFLFFGSFGGFTGNNQAKGVELYEDKRFLTITGDHVEGTPFSIEKRDLTKMGKRYKVNKKPNQNNGSGNKAKVVSEAPADNSSNVSIDEFLIPPHVRDWIINGTPEGTRSDRIFQAAKDLIREGATAAQALDILADPRHRISDTGTDRRGNTGGAREWIWRYAVLPAEQAIELEKTAQDFEIVPTVSRGAERLAAYIEEQLVQRLEIESDEVIESLKINPANIEKWINGSFWNGSGSKLHLLNHNSDLIEFRESEAAKFMAKTFGAIQDVRRVSELALSVATGNEAAQVKFIAQTKAIAGDTVLDHIKYYNQRVSVEWRVDMFAKKSRVELIEDKARIVLAHKPFSSEKAAKVIDKAIVEDYKTHFPRFDETLEFIVASRFASDRKKAYLWIKADSDWGKGFFIDLLQHIGACVMLKEREVEKMFDGNPSGRSPEDFKRSFALVFNEFKTVKSELKELESGLSLAPKHKLTSRVEVFAKLFFSAENVGSLVTENGVEDQFANRFSMFEEKGSIEDRELWQRKGKSYYFKHVLSYTIWRLNGLVAELQELGKDKAEAFSDAFLDNFIGKHGIDTLHQRYSESLPDIAADAVAWIKKFSDDDFTNPKAPTVIQHLGDHYLKSPRKAIEQFIEATFDRSAAPSMMKKKDELLRLMSAETEGKSTRTYRIPEPTTALKLRRETPF